MRKGILITLIIILLGGGAWYFYTKSKVATTGEQPAVFKSFFPVGTTTPSTTPDGSLTPSTNNPIAIPQTKSQPFKQLSPSAVAGYSAFPLTTTITTPALKPKGKPTKQTIVEQVIRYVARTSGYVYEIKKGDVPTQISNVYIPNIYEAFFGDGGRTAILRFLRDDKKTIASYSVPIPDQNIDGSRTQKEGKYLPDSISALTISPDGTTIARLTDEIGTAVLSTTNTMNAGRKELLRTPFHEWIPSWSGKDIYLQTKASGSTEGFFYQVDQSKKRLVRILGNIPGLTASISPNGTYVLYSQSTSNGFTTKILTVKTGVTRSVGNSILPEKCAWLKNEDLICAGGGSTPNGTYPDDWYMGTIHFSDQLLRVYTAVNTFDVLYTPSDDYSFDMTNLQVDEASGVLYFIDKPTGLLWQFTL
jgi:hypothetical protein